MKKYCFEALFENVSGGYVLADSWAEAIQVIQQIRREKYPEMDDHEEDVVSVKLVGMSVAATH